MCAAACRVTHALQGGNQISDGGASSLSEALKWAKTVVTTSSWFSLDTCVAGNEVSHNLAPFKAKRLRGTTLPCYNGKPKHSFRPPCRIAADTQDTPSSVWETTSRELRYSVHTKPERECGTWTHSRTTNSSCLSVPPIQSAVSPSLIQDHSIPLIPH